MSLEIILTEDGSNSIKNTIQINYFFSKTTSIGLLLLGPKLLAWRSFSLEHKTYILNARNCTIRSLKTPLVSSILIKKSSAGNEVVTDNK